jgi:hypothetical protein
VTPPVPMRPDARGPVLLVVTAGAVSKSVIFRAAELAGTGTVTVVAIAPAPGRQAGPAHAALPSARTEQERLRRTVASAMDMLESLGVTASGHIAVTRSPGRTLARVARARAARAVVLDRCPPAAGTVSASDAAVELRRRMHGSGLIVEMAAGERPVKNH